MSSLKDKRSSKTEAAARLADAAPAPVAVGYITAIEPDGVPLVEFAGNPAGQPVRALATARYTRFHAGASVALMFVDNDRSRPLAIGLIEPEAAPESNERLTSADREIVLQCGPPASC
jgi:hypothetical protein